MAKSITIIRGLNQQSPALTAPLVSVYAPTGIEFDFERESLTNSYSEVSVGAYVFKAVKVSTVGTVDRYQIAVDWLQYLTSLPTSVTNITPTSITYTITGRDSIGVSQATATATVLLSFGVPDMYSQRGMYDVYSNGASSMIYHAGRYSRFNGTIYEILSATSSSATTTYRQTTGEEIAWLNTDGGWSFWNFKKIGKKLDIKNSNFVSTFALFNYEQMSAGRNVSQEKTIELDFKTVAINTEHHEQLCLIKQSKQIWYNGRIYEVKECTQSTGAEKQNLGFTLTLESKENAASN
jgi:hypothetical protein